MSARLQDLAFKFAHRYHMVNNREYNGRETVAEIKSFNVVKQNDGSYEGTIRWTTEEKRLG